MKLSKNQIIYIISSVIFVAVIVLIPYLKIMRENKKNGDEIVPELANMKEMGKTRILQGIYGNATFMIFREN